MQHSPRSTALSAKTSHHVLFLPLEANYLLQRDYVLCELHNREERGNGHTKPYSSANDKQNFLQSVYVCHADTFQLQ